MSVNTVRKYVKELEERTLIRTERTTITTRDGRRQNGCLCYHILPIQMSIDRFYERQFSEADGDRQKHGNGRRSVRDAEIHGRQSD